MTLFRERKAHKFRTKRNRFLMCALQQNLLRREACRHSTVWKSAELNLEEKKIAEAKLANSSKKGTHLIKVLFLVIKSELMIFDYSSFDCCSFAIERRPVARQFRCSFTRQSTTSLINLKAAFIMFFLNSWEFRNF